MSVVSVTDCHRRRQRDNVVSVYITLKTFVFFNSIVELNRTNYQEPELLSQKKSDVILSKKTVLTGEVVNGGPLPNPPQHVPVCSFDSKNKYCGEVPHVEPTTSESLLSVNSM